MRLKKGDAVELFDDAGNAANAVVETCNASEVIVRAGEIRANEPGLNLTVASAIPKGDRADWMIEKLSELGVRRFIPLRTERSVVHPKGDSKTERWKRLATESAKQSKRAGVMQFDELADLEDAVAAVGALGFFLSTAADVRPLLSLLETAESPATSASAMSLFIGPEGGWSDVEISLFQTRGLTPASLGRTILRVETAAVVAAALALAR